MQLLACMEGHNGATGPIRILIRHPPGLLDQRHGVAVPRHPIEVRAVEAGESLQAVQRAGLLKRLRVQRQRDRRAEAARAPAVRLLRARPILLKTYSEADSKEYSGSATGALKQPAHPQSASCRHAAEFYTAEDACTAENV